MTTEQEQRKQQVAGAAAEMVRDGMVLGVGTGSTVNCFIQALADRRIRLEAAVSSSQASTRELQRIGVAVSELNDVGTLELYIDGADEVDPQRRLIKGGGGALTREKIIAAASRRFVCIVDESKLVDLLGAFPLPVEVIPMARSYVARQLVLLGGQPQYREGFVSDNGNHILDVHNLKISDPVGLEQRINGLAGVVTVGLFAQRGADEVLVAGASGLRRF